MTRFLEIVFLSREGMRRPVWVVVTWWLLLLVSAVLYALARAGLQWAGLVSGLVFLMLMLYLTTPATKR